MPMSPRLAIKLSRSASTIGRQQLIWMPGMSCCSLYAVPSFRCGAPADDAAGDQFADTSSILCSKTDSYLSRWHHSRTSPPATD